MRRTPTPLLSRTLLILLAIATTFSWSALAAAPADPYADAVDSTTGGAVLNAANALGAPDGTVATVVGILGSNLVLDMGAGEEGTGDLRVYYRGLTVGVATTVRFLNANKQVIASSSLNLAGLGTGNYMATVAYPQSPTP